MLKEIGFNQPDNKSPITPQEEADKLYEALRTCYEHYQEMIKDSDDDYPLSATVDYGVIIEESSYTTFHSIEIVIPDELDFNTLMLVSKNIINECEEWGWVDTDAVQWKIQVNNGFHYDKAISSIKITLEDWAS